MCGFVGFVSKDGNKKKIIKDMADIIVHRGPDSDGYYVDDNVALGFRRLSIIDLDGGNQPIFNEKKDKVIVFNGEIYNYKEIKEELLEKGHVFETESDTEVVIHGYEEYKEKILDKLRGMFAFVIYDINNNSLFGARDFYGIKPMYYYHDKNAFMFGSEIKSFLGHPGFVKELNKDMLKQLYQLDIEYTPYVGESTLGTYCNDKITIYGEEDGNFSYPENLYPSTFFHEEIHSAFDHSKIPVGKGISLLEAYCGAVQLKYTDTTSYTQEQEYLLIISKILSIILSIIFFL